MKSYEDKFRSQFPDCRLEQEFVSTSLTRFHVVIGTLHCSESALRDYAFKYAFEDIKEGKIVLPPRIEQMQLWPT